MGNGLTNKETDLNVTLANLTKNIAEIIAQVEENFSAFFTMQMQSLIEMSKNATLEEEQLINNKISALASLVKIKGLVDPNKPRVIIERLVYVNKEDVSEVKRLFDIINAPVAKNVTVKDDKSKKAQEAPKTPYKTIKRSPKELRANNKLIFDLQKELNRIRDINSDAKKKALDGNLVAASQLDEYEALLGLVDLLNKASGSNDALVYTSNIAYVKSEDQKAFDLALTSSNFYQENYLKPAQINAENDNLVYDLENYLKSLEQAYNSYQGTTIESGITSDNTTVLANDVPTYNDIKEMITILNDRAKNLKTVWNVGNIRNKNLTRYTELIRKNITSLINISPKFREIPGVNENLPFIINVEGRLQTLSDSNSDEYKSLETLYNCLTSSIGSSNLKMAQDGALIDKKMLKTYEQNLNPLLDYARRKEMAESLVNILTNIKALKLSAQMVPKTPMLALPEHRVKVRATRPSKTVITPDVIALPGVTLEMIERAKKVRELISAFLEASKRSNTSYLDDILKKVIEETLNPKPVAKETTNNVILALPPHQEELEEKKPTRPLREAKVLETPDVIALSGEVLEIDPELSAKIYQIIDNPTVTGILDVIAYVTSKNQELTQAKTGLQEDPELVRARKLNIDPRDLTNTTGSSPILNVSALESVKNNHVEEDTLFKVQPALPPRPDRLALEEGESSQAKAIKLGGEIKSSDEVIPLPERMQQAEVSETDSGLTVESILDLLNQREAKHQKMEEELDRISNELVVPTGLKRTHATPDAPVLALPPRADKLALGEGVPSQAKAIKLGGEIKSSDEVIPLPERMQQAEVSETDSDLTVESILDLLNQREAKHQKMEQELDRISNELVVPTGLKRTHATPDAPVLALPPRPDRLALGEGVPSQAKAIKLGGEIKSSDEVIPLPERMQQAEVSETDSGLTVESILDLLNQREAKHQEMQQKLNDISAPSISQGSISTKNISHDLKETQVKASLINVLNTIKNLKISEAEKKQVLEDETLTRKLIDKFLEIAKYDKPKKDTSYIEEKLTQYFKELINSSVSKANDSVEKRALALPAYKAKVGNARTLRQAQVLETPNVIALPEELPTHELVKALEAKNIQSSLVNVLSIIRDLKISEAKKKQVLEDETLTRKLIDKFLEIAKYDKPKKDTSYIEEKLMQAFEELINPQIELHDTPILGLPEYKKPARHAKSLRMPKVIETPTVIALEGEVKPEPESDLDGYLRRLEKLTKDYKEIVNGRNQSKNTSLVEDSASDLSKETIKDVESLIEQVSDPAVPDSDNTQTLLDEVKALIAEERKSTLPVVAPLADLAVPKPTGGKRLAKARSLNFGALETIRGMIKSLVGQGLKDSLTTMRSSQDPEDTREMLLGINRTFDKKSDNDLIMDFPTLIRFPMPQSEDQILTLCREEVAQCEKEIASLKSMIDSAPIWNMCIAEKEKINDLRIRIREIKSKAALKFLEKYKKALASNDKTNANNYRLLIFALINVDVCSNLDKAQYEIEYAPGLTEKDIIDELQEIKDKILDAHMHNPVASLAQIDSEFINIIDTAISSILADAKYSIDPELKIARLKQLIRKKTG